MYRLIGVPLLLKVTQESAWLHRLAGAAPRSVCREREELASMVRNTWARERFHLGLLIFCALCTVTAAKDKRPLWAAAPVLLNVFYNLYPMWLQQYLRLRLSRI